MSYTQEEFDSIKLGDDEIPPLREEEEKSDGASYTKEEFDSIRLGDEKPSMRDAASSNMRNSYGVDADKQAELQKKARDLGLPESTSLDEQVILEAETKKRKKEFHDQFLNGNSFLPKTEEFFTKSENAKVAWDDWENLNAFEKELQTIKKDYGDLGSFAKERLKTPMSGLAMMLEGSMGAAESVSDLPAALVENAVELLGLDETEVGQAFLEYNPYAMYSKGTRAIGDIAGESSEWWMPETESLTMQSIDQGLASATSSTVSSMASIAATGSGHYGLLAMAIQSYGSSYRTAKEQDMDLLDRYLYAAGQGGIEYLTEKLPMKHLENIFKGEGDSFVREMGATFITENLGEQLATFGQGALDVAFLPEKEGDWIKFWEERPEEALRTLISTTVSLPVQGGVMSGTGALDRKLRLREIKKQNQEFQNAAKEIQGMFQSEQEQNSLDNIIELSQNGLLNKRDPEKLAGFLKTLEEEEQYLYVSQDILSEMENIPDYLQNQLDGLGYDVEIPLSKFITEITKDEQMLQALRPHLKVRADGYSLDEMERGGDNAINEMLTQAKNVFQHNSELEEVFETQRQQFLDSGVVSNVEATHNATLMMSYVNRAAKEHNLTPKQFYEDYIKLKQVVGPETEMKEEGKVIDQAKTVGYQGQDVTEAKEWVAAREKFGEEGMTQEAREQRAKDMGFFTDENGNLVTLSRGESEDFKKFDKKKLGTVLKGPWKKAGFFFAPDKADAKGYARARGSDIVKDYYVKMSNPFRMSAEEFYGTMNWGRMPDQKYKTLAAATSAAKKRVQEIKDLGHDGVIISDDKGTYEYVVFEPNQIRSVDAAFDPDQADSSTLLAQAQKVGYEGESFKEAKEWLDGMEKFGPEGMTEEARMARAEEMGFDSDKVFYHATFTEFDSFKEGWTYLAQSREKAAHLSGYSPDTIMLELLVKKDLKLATVKDVVALRKPLVGDDRVLAWLEHSNDLYKNSGIEEEYNEIVKKYKEDRVVTDDVMRFMPTSRDPETGIQLESSIENIPDYVPLNKYRSSSVSYITPEEVEALKAQGFDGAVGDIDQIGGKEIIVFDPRNIRSVNAAFDPDQAGSSKLLAQNEPSVEDLLGQLVDEFNDFAPNKDFESLSAEEFSKFLDETIQALKTSGDLERPDDVRYKPERDFYQGRDDLGFMGWTEERLQSQIDYAEVKFDDMSRAQVVFINPIDFVYATAGDPQRISREAGELDMDKLREEVKQTPFLYIEDGQIVGHEGRHRMMALAKAGYTRVPIVIEDRSDDKPKYKTDDDGFAVGESITVKGQDFGKYKEGDTESLTFEAGHVLMSKNKEAIMEEMAQAQELFQPAYHGTPHTFDKFSLAAIGTGEGAQAYGWGLYFAGVRRVAEFYKKSTKYKDMVRQFTSLLPDNADFSEVMDMVESGEFDERKSRILKALNEDDWLGFDYPAQAISAAFREIDNFDPSPELRSAIDDYGNLFEVEIPEDNELLDWDKSYEEQSDFIKEKLKAAGIDFSGKTGKKIYYTITPDATDPREASMALNDLGIKGLRYENFDRGSLGAGHNYVIWDEDAVTVKAVNDELRQAQELANEEANKAVEFFQPELIIEDKSEVLYEEAKQRIISGLESWSAAFALEGGTLSPVEGEFSQAELYRAESDKRNQYLSEEFYEPTPEEGKLEQEKLLKEAKENGFFYEANSDALKAVESSEFSGGNEHVAYLAMGEDSDVVVRATKDGKFGHGSEHSPAKYLKRLENFNKTFPDYPIVFLGVTQNADGSLVMLTGQPYVDAAKFDDNKDLDVALRKEGWYPVTGSKETYKHHESGAIVTDVNKNNVLSGQDGKLYFIDVAVTDLPKQARPQNTTTPAKSSDTLTQRQDAQKEKRIDTLKRVLDCMGKG